MSNKLKNRVNEHMDPQHRTCSPMVTLRPVCGNELFCRSHYVGVMVTLRPHPRQRTCSPFALCRRDGYARPHHGQRTRTLFALCRRDGYARPAVFTLCRRNRQSIIITPKLPAVCAEAKLLVRDDD